MPLSQVAMILLLLWLPFTALLVVLNWVSFGPQPPSPAATTALPPKPPPGRHKDDHLRILMTLYAVSFTLGLVYIAEGVYQPGTSAWMERGSRAAVQIFVALVLFFIGLRFFFAPQELARYLDVARDLAKKKRLERGPSDQAVVLLLYPMMLVHAFIYYTACRVYSFEESFFQGQATHVDGELVYLICVLLLVNVSWLLMLLLPVMRMSFEVYGGGDRKRPREVMWISSNLIVGLVCLLVAAMWEDEKHHGIPESTLVFVMVLFLMNSLADLFFAASHYVPQE